MERTIARQSEGGENIVAILLSTTNHTSFSEHFLCLFYLAFVFVFAMSVTHNEAHFLHAGHDEQHRKENIYKIVQHKDGTSK